VTTGRDRRPRRRWAAALVVAIAAAGCGADLTGPPPDCDAAPALQPGNPQAGTLGVGDRRWGGAFIQYWSIQPRAPGRAQVQLTTVDFEPFLLLFDGRGTVIDQAFDPEPPAAGPRTATLDRVLPGACTLVGVSSWRAQGAGSYLVSLTWTEPGS
jgi:hypothetical protein